MLSASSYMFGRQAAILRQFGNNKQSQVQHTPKALIALTFIITNKN